MVNTLIVTVIIKKSHKCFSGGKVEVHFIILGIMHQGGGGGGVMPKAYDCVKWKSNVICMYI